MSYAVAEKLIKDALANDPRTKSLRVSRNGSMISLSEVADSDSLASQTNDDLRMGLGLPGTRITLVGETNWKGIIIEARRSRYVVERTESRTGRGMPGKRFVVPFQHCILDR